METTVAAFLKAKAGQKSPSPLHTTVEGKNEDFSAFNPLPDMKPPEMVFPVRASEGAYRNVGNETKQFYAHERKKLEEEKGLNRWSRGSEDSFSSNTGNEDFGPTAGTETKQFQVDGRENVAKGHEFEHWSGENETFYPSTARNNDFGPTVGKETKQFYAHERKKLEEEGGFQSWGGENEVSNLSNAGNEGFGPTVGKETIQFYANERKKVKAERKDDRDYRQQSIPESSDYPVFVHESEEIMTTRVNAERLEEPQLMSRTLRVDHRIDRGIEIQERQVQLLNQGYNPLSNPSFSYGQEEFPEDFLQLKKNIRKSTLRFGTFCTEEGSQKDFVFVQNGYEAPAGESTVKTILKALQIPPPQLTFYHDKVHGVAPIETGEAGKACGTCYPRPVDAQGIKLVEDRLLSVLNGISDACAQTESIHLLLRPFRGNRLSELVCNSALLSGCKTLGLYVMSDLTYMDDSRGGMTDPLDEAQFDKAIHENRQNHASKETLSEEVLQQIRWKYHMKVAATDPLRKNIPLQVWLNATASSPSEVEKVIPIHTSRTEYEESYFRTFGLQYSGSLVSELTHVVVFESWEGRANFFNQYLQEFKVGVLAAGILGSGMQAGIDCFQTNTPMFVFRGSGGASECLARLVDLGKILKDPKLSKQEKRGDAASFVKGMQEEFTKGIWKEGWMKNAAELTLVTAKNFPKTFSPDSALVIDLREDERKWKQLPVEELQDKITSVMASVHSQLPELGGQIAELKSLKHASALQKRLQDAGNWYWIEGCALQIIIRLLMISTTIAVAVQANQLIDENKISATTQTAAGWNFSMILPLLIGVFSTVESTVRPTAKHAAFWAASKRLESELYRFRTCTSSYRRDHGPPNRSRKMLASACDSILSELGQSDVRTGAVPLVDITSWGFSSHRKIVLTTPRNHELFRFGRKVTPAQKESRTTKLIARDERHNQGTNKDDDENYSNKSLFQKEHQANIEGEDDNENSIKQSETVFLQPENYINERLIEKLNEIQSKGPWMRKQLRFLQFLVICGSAAAVALQSSSEQTQLVHIVLGLVGAVEFVMAYMHYDTQLPAVSATVTALTRVLVWWDGLSLIQQRMPSSRETLVELVEGAILLQEEGYVRSELTRLGNNLNEEEINTKAVEKKSA